MKASCGLLVAALVALPAAAQAVDCTSGQIFSSSDTCTVPAKVTSMTIHAIGGGGGGGKDRAISTDGGAAGGGGGSYCGGQNIPVTPGATLTVVVGAGGGGATKKLTPGGAGGFSEVTGAGVTGLRANGGSGGGTQTGGAGGTTAACTLASATMHAGGKGGDSQVTQGGAGGGGAAGASGSGSDGTTALSYEGVAGGAGGSGSPQGGAGGRGGDEFFAGFPGNAPGGGGGGAGQICADLYYGDCSVDFAGRCSEALVQQLCALTCNACQTGEDHGGDGASGSVVISFVDTPDCTSGQAFTSSGHCVVPDGVRSMTIHAIGGGGGGGVDAPVARSGGAAGGGGGSYCGGEDITVTPGALLTVVVGAGGSGATTIQASGTDGGYSEVTGAGVTGLRANGGSGGGTSSGGAGGTTAACSLAAAAMHVGGNGGGSDYSPGGGGGGAAGAAASGGNGTSTTSSSGGGPGGAGGTGTPQGGAGGSGGDQLLPGVPGNAPGGGGGGAGQSCVDLYLGDCAADFLTPVNRCAEVLVQELCKLTCGQCPVPVPGGDGASGSVVISFEILPDCTSGQVFNSSGKCVLPAGVTSVTLHAIGGGGGGGKGGGGAAGGGGGSYCGGQSIPVTPGATLKVVVGAGGSGATTDLSSGTAGGYSEVTGGGVTGLRANGGGGGGAHGGTVGAGGTTAACTLASAAMHDGGSGGNAESSGGGGGGGGAGAAGAGSHGTSGSSSTGAAGGTGGSGTPQGGAGGTGGNQFHSGVPGSAPGGGGGGAGLKCSDLYPGDCGADFAGRCDQLLVNSLCSLTCGTCQVGADNGADGAAGSVVILFPPVAGDQPVSTNEDTAVAIVLAATNPAGGPLTFAVVTGPAHGALSGTAPNVTYTPAPNYNGPDSFTFTAANGTTVSAPATVGITVAPVNDAPAFLAPIGNRSVSEGSLLAFTASASDSEGDPLTYGITGLPPGASFSAATGEFLWVPGYDQEGVYPVTVTVSDGSLSDEEALTITVTGTNRPPALVLPPDFAVVEGEVVSFRVAAPDPDGDAVALSVVALPPGAAFDPASGNFLWRPLLDQAGTHVASFRATDAGTPAASVDGTVSITVINPGGPVFFDDFADGASPEDWTILGGAWRALRGAYAAASPSKRNFVRVVPLDPDTFPLGAGVVQAKVKLTRTTSRVLPNGTIVFGFQSPTSYRWVRVSADGIRIGQTGTIDGIRGGTKKRLARRQPVGRVQLITVKVAPDGWVRVYKGTAARPALSYQFLNGTTPSVVPGGVGLAAAKAKTVFDDVTVWEDSGP